MKFQNNYLSVQGGIIMACSCYCNDETCIHNIDGMICSTKPTIDIKDCGFGHKNVCESYRDKDDFTYRVKGWVICGRKL